MRLRAHVLGLLVVSACAVDPTVEPPVDDPGDIDDPVTGESCPARDVLAQRCGELASAPSYLSLAADPDGVSNAIVLLDPATGTTCPVVQIDHVTPGSPNSIHTVTALAALGTDAFYCASTGFEALGPLTKVSMIDGSVVTSSFMCRSVATHDGKLATLIDIGSPLRMFSSFDDVLAATSSPLLMADCAVRLGSGDGNLYSTWPTLSTVYVFEPKANIMSKFAITETTIDVWGMAARDGTFLVLDSVDDSVQHLFAFDAITGTLGGKVLIAPPRPDAPGTLRGLAAPCDGASAPIL